MDPAGLIAKIIRSAYSRDNNSIPSNSINRL
jgi:hypothetical protein